MKLGWWDRFQIADGFVPATARLLCAGAIVGGVVLAGRSVGKSEPSSYQEGVDSYDAIEWVARQPWCSGNVGMLGISYHASSQWRAANMPPCAS